MFTNINPKTNSKTLNFHVVSGNNKNASIFDKIKEICTLLNLNKKIEDLAKRLYQKYALVIKIRKLIIKASVFVFLSCHIEKAPRPYQDFIGILPGIEVKAFFESVRQMKKIFRMSDLEISTKLEKSHYSLLIQKFSKKYHFSKNQIKLAIEFAKTLETKKAKLTKISKYWSLKKPQIIVETIMLIVYILYEVKNMNENIKKDIFIHNVKKDKLNLNVCFSEIIEDLAKYFPTLIKKNIITIKKIFYDIN